MPIRYRTVSRLVRRLAAQNNLPTRWPDPVVVDLPVGRLARSHRYLSPLERGIEFHNALDRYNRGEWIKREYLPFVRVIIGWLKGLAPEKIYSEWDLNGHSLRGRPDLFVIGGTLNCRGILEVKVSGRGSPLVPTPEAVAQMALYPLSDHGSPGRFFGALAYVDLVGGNVRLFVWQSLEGTCPASCLRAAA